MKHNFRLLAGAVFCVFVGAALFCFAMFQGDQVSWFLFFGYLPIFLYEIGSMFAPLKTWHVKRVVSRQLVQAGDTVTVRLEIERTWPWPLFYCVAEEVFSEQLHQPAPPVFGNKQQGAVPISCRRMKRILFPWMAKKMRIEYQLEQIPRGAHLFQGLWLRTSDLFGLVKKEYLFASQDLLLAYPNERALPMVTASPLQADGTESLRITKEATNIAAGARAYVPGDRLSAIDWKKTAQTQTLMTKEFEQETGSETWLILDACAYKDMNPSAFEASVEIALGLIRKHAGQERGHFLAIDEQTNRFRLADKADETAVLHHLARMQPGKRYPFAHKLKEALLLVKGPIQFVIITTNMNELLKETILRASVRPHACSVIYIQSDTEITEGIKRLISQLRAHGTEVQIWTEETLGKQTAGVEVQ